MQQEFIIKRVDGRNTGQLGNAERKRDFLSQRLRLVKGREGSRGKEIAPPVRQFLSCLLSGGCVCQADLLLVWVRYCQKYF
jgi:hypothetical protein